jgi:hypothetical protein
MGLFSKRGNDASGVKKFGFDRNYAVTEPHEVTMPHCIEIAKAKLCPDGSKKIGFVWHHAPTVPA